MTAGGAAASLPLAGMRTLVVEDEDDLRLGLRRLISKLGAEVREARDGREAVASMEKDPAELVITDLMMPRMSGTELLQVIKSRWPATEVVIVTGYGTIQTAVTCLRAGAAHFLTKPFDNSEVLQIVERLGRQVAAARTPPKAELASGFVAVDPATKRMVELADRVSRSPVPVLIEGESGTGKELVARYVHGRSAVAERPFLAVNAAALPDTLLESELFGYRKGAFTGADRDREGLFVEARGGTVFLDEVASMSSSFQGKLLRVLQEKVVRPLGGTRDVAVDFRLISASNRDLEALIRQGAFREDLFYRLSVVRLHVPPLRERPLDLEPLARRFLAAAAELCLPPGSPAPTLGEPALDLLRSWSWPGNVRELQNVIQRAVIVCGGEEILPHHLGLQSTAWREPEPGELDYNASKQRAIERFQREYVQRALEHTKGNISHAADRCGLTRAAFQRILRQLGIERGDFSSDR